MTRFARSLGSKGDNQREPEQPTGWNKMKEMMKNKDEGKLRNPEEEDEEDEGVEEDEIEQDQDQVEDEEDESGNEEMGKVEIKKEEVEEKKKLSKTQKRKEKNQDKCLQCKMRGHRKVECPELSQERRKELKELIQMKQERKGKGKGKKKKKRKEKNGEQKEEGNNNRKREEKKKKVFEEKEKAGLNVKKDKTGQIVQEDEGTFQGFRVKKEDVDVLKKMQKKLQSEGIKGQELEALMKRERRRAEKELARFKKMLCFGCRKQGHLLAECPVAQKDALESRSVGERE